MNERELGVQILANLSGVREDMLALIDVLWDAINPRDAASRESGTNQIDVVERQVKSIDAVSTELAQMLKLHVGLVEEEMPGNRPGVPTSPGDSVFSGRVAHSLDEDMTSTKPIGYAFEGTAVKNMTAWSEVYVALCRELAHRDPARFGSLADNPRFTTSRHHLLFSRTSGTFYTPKLVADGVYAETRLPVKSVCKRLKKVFREFGIDKQELKLYLRWDADLPRDPIA